MNNFMQIYEKAKHVGLRIIAAPYAQKGGFKGWNRFKGEDPNANDIEQWASLDKCNVDLITGEPSGVIALDFDCEDPELIALIEPLLPTSKCAKVGAKGWTRFFKYTPTFSESITIKSQGKVVFEILSNNKKCTIPPSKHPSGKDYEWIGEPLWECKDKLEILPPATLANIRQVLHARDSKWELEQRATGNTIKMINGRNDALSSYVGQLISEKRTLDDAVSALIAYDKEQHDVPLFTDTTEMLCSEPYTNALQFYTNHLVSFNTKNLRENKEPIVPLLPSAVNEKHLEIIEAGKQLPKARERKEICLPLANANTALGKLQSTILENSYVQQPAFAISASLALMGTLISRKVVFEGVSPNLYLLNIAPSGAGKDAPQQMIKRLMYNTQSDHLLGAGDYVSDASITDSLPVNQVRLDLMDEVSGLLSSVNNGGEHYNRKMAEIYCELFSCSNDIYAGRATADGRKGKCVRPNVNILGSTTPAAFSKVITRHSIENGLLARFLIFYGEGNKRARRLKEPVRAPDELLKAIDYWNKFEPKDTSNNLGTITQKYRTICASAEGNKELEKHFNKFEDLKINLPETDIRRPIARRMYQLLLKVSCIHACSRITSDDDLDALKVEVEDIQWAAQVVDYHFEMLYQTVMENLTESKHHKNYMDLLKHIPFEGCSKMQLANNTLFMPKKYRDSLITELYENGHILVEPVNNEVILTRIR